MWNKNNTLSIKGKKKIKDIKKNKRKEKKKADIFTNNFF